MRRAILTVAILGAFTACGGGSYSGYLNDCSTLVVENQNFADVVVRSQYRRLGTVQGLRTDTLQVCGMTSQVPIFRVRAIGGAFEYEVSGTRDVQSLAPSSLLHMVIGASPQLSYVIGAGYNVGPGTFEVVGAFEVRPTNMHQGLWYDVASCLGVVSVPDPLRVTWVLADSIKGSDGLLAYGLSSWPDPAAIIVERGYWLHPGVVSHEVVHLLTGDESETSEGMRCVMRMASDLPLRRWR